ncbi:hypothetical protein BJ508DRAFT_350726 [Ascobolus immersus RN42]|uniref:Uncharacterized protein n=1 Tax=Ascobolus immersus RN42 TaxID=1160509 RepID=A0A3N4I5U1_ASCIM|nr:hypothetical protein BJ508DRAFT_350726 [Ascobolus immersus RN42]
MRFNIDIRAALVLAGVAMLATSVIAVPVDDKQCENTRILMHNSYDLDPLDGVANIRVVGEICDKHVKMDPPPGQQIAGYSTGCTHLFDELGRTEPSEEIFKEYTPFFRDFLGDSAKLDWMSSSTISDLEKDIESKTEAERKKLLAEIEPRKKKLVEFQRLNQLIYPNFCCQDVRPKDDKHPGRWASCNLEAQKHTFCFASKKVACGSPEHQKYEAWLAGLPEASIPYATDFSLKAFIWAGGSC